MVDQGLRYVVALSEQHLAKLELLECFPDFPNGNRSVSGCVSQDLLELDDRQVMQLHFFLVLAVGIRRRNCGLPLSLVCTAPHIFSYKFI